MQHEDDGADELEDPWSEFPLVPQNWMRAQHRERLSELHEEIDERFGDNLRRTRQQAEFTQRALSAEVREVTGVAIDASAIARIEAGQRSVSLRQAAALAVTLDVTSIDHLIVPYVRMPLSLEDHARVLSAGLRQAERELEVAEADASAKREEIDRRRARLETVRQQLARESEDPEV